MNFIHLIITYIRFKSTHIKNGHLKCPFSFGRGRRDRTLGTRFWRPLLYLLSYTPVFWWAFRDSNPGPTGYEPVALTN